MSSVFNAFCIEILDISRFFAQKDCLVPNLKNNDYEFELKTEKKKRVNADILSVMHYQNKCLYDVFPCFLSRGLINKPFKPVVTNYGLARERSNTVQYHHDH